MLLDDGGFCIKGMPPWPMDLPVVGILLGAILQAASLFETGNAKPLRTMLLPGLQRLVVSEWIQIRASRRPSFEPWLLDKFLQDDLGWIAANSGGAHQEAAREQWAVKVP